MRAPTTGPLPRGRHLWTPASGPPLTGSLAPGWSSSRAGVSAPALKDTGNTVNQQTLFITMSTHTLSVTSCVTTHTPSTVRFSSDKRINNTFSQSLNVNYFLKKLFKLFHILFLVCDSLKYISYHIHNAHCEVMSIDHIQIISPFLKSPRETILYNLRNFQKE